MATAWLSVQKFTGFIIRDLSGLTRSVTQTSGSASSSRLFRRRFTCSRHSESSTSNFNFTRMSTESCGRERLDEYTVPDWLDGKLKFQPKYRVKLANLPTRIHKWTLPGLPEGFSLSIKRDDDTGGTLSGNKVRKLEFLFADAIDKGCKHVATCGGIQSNHCRATAVAAVQCGLTPHLFLRADVQSPDDVGCEGNLLLNRLCGAKMYFIPTAQATYETFLKPRMEKLAEKIKETTGEDTYHIPIGGSNAVGIFGYLHAFEELRTQGVLEQYDDIVFACGSGGTAEGLAVGNFLTGSKLKVHGILVSDSTKYFVDHVNKCLAELGLINLRSEDILDLIEGYKGKGYGKSTQDELDFITDVGVKTGVMLDPVYSGKAVYGLIQELRKSPERFQGSRILFIHTGGIYGLYDGRINDILMQKGAATDQIFMWPNIEDPIEFRK